MTGVNLEFIVPMSESDDIFGYACGIVRLKVVTKTLEKCADLFFCTVKRDRRERQFPA